MRTPEEIEASKVRRFLYMKKWLSDNRERLAARFRKWCADNKDHRRAYKLNWSRTHKDSVRKTYIKQYAKDPDRYRRKVMEHYIKNKGRANPRRKRYEKGYYLKNKDEILRRSAAYSKANPHVRKKSAIKYRLKHPDRYAAQNKAARTKRKAVMRGAKIGCKKVNESIRSLRMNPWFICSYCFEKFDTKDMHVDHIVPVVRGGKHSYDNVSESCPTCNIKKKAQPLLLFLLKHWDKSPSAGLFRN